LQTIWQRVKTPGGWRYRRIEEGRGKRTGDRQPPFYVRPSVSGAQIWQRLKAETFAEARQEAEQFEAVLDAAAKGLTVAEAENLVNLNRVPLKTAVETYLDQKKSKAPKTYAQYRLALHEFMEIAGRKIRFLDEITPDVLRTYKRRMEQNGFAGRTIHVRLNVVYFLLKKNGSPVRLPVDEMPTTEDEPAIPYSDEEMTKLFAGMKNDEERLLYKFFLGTACRSKEVKFAAWSDLNFDKKTFTVRGKPDVGFTVKNHESRTMRLPATLIELLRARRKNNPHTRWIFVNHGGGPGNHFLRRLKEIALRVGLNCGQCRTVVSKGKYDHKHKVEVTCKTDPVCEHIYLHRLRKTCATRWQEHGIPIRTIQAWLGHKNLETSMLYLGVTDTEKLGTQVDTAFGD
jgi:integrase/recombinase XerD